MVQVTDPESILLRDATLADGPLIIWLEEVCMKDYATELWGQWYPSSTLTELNVSDHQIIEYNGLGIGCVALNWSDDCLFLAKLYLGPDYRNQRIGAYVLQLIVQFANARQVPIKLSVLRTNPAIKFYLREGFCIEDETAERRKLVKQPYETE